MPGQGRGKRVTDFVLTIDMNADFKKIDMFAGWAVFAVSAAVYLLTVEPTASLWDCGEFIALADKLEIGHSPGAPFFMLVGNLF